MKKIYLLSILLLSAVTAFSQPSSVKTYNGFVSEFRFREINAFTKVPMNWSEWQKPDVMVIYFDAGFSTIAVTNSRNSRFLITTQLADTTIDTTRVLKFHCIDNNAIGCNVAFNMYPSGTVVLSIEYNNVEVEYKTPKMEMGYPYIYFGVMEQREMDRLKEAETK
ncbi:MAG: hypothetical protein EHM34_03390 [Nitrosopumilales archaeon]|nr:MAG: hypothetical protein EHM34_03390 [Nitrosopumilales archaeon]